MGHYGHVPKLQTNLKDDAVAKSYVKDLLASSEVVLIETRQHWMAAVRFVLRPILIALAAVGLIILNEVFNFNDDQFFSFINDLISFAIVILFLIAVVWLPIDLIRWDSRRFVLTNRRSMRVAGVLRKTSFDTSLEQINDIGLVEPTVGRLLGYADLTLYTASDTANATYDQLVDGLQFKKAVLDAKEAIRVGTPLTSLPEGFIVKGGTNEASMRADGKIVDEEEVDEAAAPAPEQDEQSIAAPPPAPEPEPIAPEPIAEPALVVEPEPAPVVEPEPAPVVEPEPVVEPDSESAGSDEPKAF